MMDECRAPKQKERWHNRGGRVPFGKKPKEPGARHQSNEVQAVRQRRVRQEETVASTSIAPLLTLHMQIHRATVYAHATHSRRLRAQGEEGLVLRDARVKSP